MAATGTPTPNIGLRIPQGTDPASVDDINYNSNLLDTKLGAVGSTSVQDQIDSLNSNTVKITDRVAIDRNVNGSVADCNNVTETGFYRIINTTGNRPFSYGVLFNLMSNSYNVQIAISVGTDKGDMYCRGYGNGAWSEWKKCN